MKGKKETLNQCTICILHCINRAFKNTVHPASCSLQGVHILKQSVTFICPHHIYFIPLYSAVATVKINKAVSIAKYVSAQDAKLGSGEPVVMHTHPTPVWKLVQPLNRGQNVSIVCIVHGQSLVVMCNSSLDRVNNVPANI